MRQRGGSEQPVKGRRANRPKSRKVSTVASPVADLQKQMGILTRELKEAREQQTATSDVLKVISSSTFDLQQVFETLAKSAVRLCSAERGFVFRFDGQLLRFTVGHNLSPEFRDFLERNPITPGRDSNAGRAAIERRTVHNLDVQSDPEYNYGGSGVDPYRTVLAVPMLKADELFGVFVIYRHEVRPFNDSQIALMETFADQAVIAIENARLLNETKESLEQQIATSEVLQVINSSPGDLEPVFDAMLDKAMRLCEASFGGLAIPDGELARWVASRGVPEAFDNWLAHQKFRLSSLLGPSFRDRSLLHVLDVKESEGYRKRIPSLVATVELGGARTCLLVPLVKDDGLVGVIVLYRQEVRAFSDKQIALLQNFAAQAVIAIENTRLLNETREALERQTATADILKVIASSPSDVQPVFDAIAERSKRLIGGFSSMVLRVFGGMAHLAAFTSTGESADAAVKAMYPRPTADIFVFDLLRGGEVVQVEDVETSPEAPERIKELARLRGYRSIIYTPLISNGGLIGIVIVSRKNRGKFEPRHVELLKTFADQAVIAIQNVRLFGELQDRTQELSKSLEDLRTAQDRLVQTEKLASLGQLTAGIAHEIKNPLNFVNNFSALSAELVDEMNDVLQDAGLAGKKREEVDEIRNLLKSNLEKVVQHGKRADSIVKNMLLHSREGLGERRSADINALVAESLNLAHHGARAEKPGFSIKLKHDLDPEAGVLDLYPQEITRALLNLISNGFYAATRRKVDAGDGVFEPVLSAATRNLGKTVEIRIRDNGTGIPPEVRQKMFNPFFTTKPTGEGTGLGLSMAHDIIVKQHGGRIDVETEPGVFAEFIITLPRDNGTAAGPKP
jgi:GAF domain-containing protein